MMRFTPALWACFFSFSVAAQELEQSFRLTDLAEMAKTHNAALLSIKGNIDIQLEEVAIIRSGLLPNAYFQANVDVSRGESSTQNSDNIGLVVSETLSFPQFRQIEAAQKRTEATRLRYEEAQQNLLLQVINAWLVMMETAESLDLIEARQKNLNEQLKRAEALQKAGRGTLVDVLQSRAGLAAVRAQLASAKNDLEIAEADIIQMAGGKARLAFLDPLAALPNLLDLDKWLSRVVMNSPAQASFRAETDALRVLLKVAEDAIYPTFSLKAQIYSTEGISKYSKSLGVSLQQLLYSGGRISAEERKLIAQINQMMANLRAVERSEAQEVRRLHAERVAGLSEIDALQVAKDASEAALKSITIGYGEGVYLAADILDAEENLFSIQSQLRQVRYGYLRNWAALYTLAGEISANYVTLLDRFFIER